MMSKWKKGKVLCLIIFLLLLYFFITILQQRVRIKHSEVPRDSDPMNSSREQFIHVFDYDWTILLAVNDGFHNFFSNWWWHFQRLGINVPIIVVAEDETAYTKLRAEFQYHGNISVTIERSSVGSIAEAVRYGTHKYKKIVSARATHILKHLQQGLNVFYTDVDTVWLKNPFPCLNGNYNMWIAQGARELCTGFMAIKSNNKTMKLMRDWEQSLNETLQVNQPIFNKILKESDVQFKPLDANMFPTGPVFDAFNAQRRGQVTVMHNTFAFGYQGKLEQFKKLNLWFQTL